MSNANAQAPEFTFMIPMVSMWLTHIDMAIQWFTIFAYIWILKLLSPLGSSGLFQTQVRMLFFQMQSGDLGGAGMVRYSRRWDGYWCYFPFQLTTAWLFGTMEFYDFPYALW